MVIPILFEDNSLLVIDKPVGISVSEGTEAVGEVSSDTIKDWVRMRYKYKVGIGGAEDEFEQRYGIVHRLDKDTSGILLIAKNKEVFQYLKGLFKFRRICKEYQALVYGIIKDRRFEISAPIARNKNTGTSFSVDAEGRDSTTEFQVLDHVAKQTPEGGELETTYLNACPKTGRTHQIRVHLKALGHPVVNDTKYANKALLKMSEGVFSRMMLHAKKISFIDWNGENRSFESPVSLSDFFQP